MKIQFIVVGWYYNQDTLQEGLKSLNDNNDKINVFYSCHKEPTQYIKDNFDWKLFPNLGEEQVAYQQALEHLNLEDDTYCFFINDDLVIKNWAFIEKCINKLQQGYKVVGNGYNPGFKAYNPLVTIPIGITEEFDGKQSIDYVQEKNRHFFEGPIEMNMVRGSFWSMQYSTVKAIGGFEPRKEAWVPFNINENGKAYYRGCEDVSNTKTGGLARFGNLFANLTIYKINKIFGKNSITWLDPKSYRNSEYIYELERGID
jgi:hypothetical protein